MPSQRHRLSILCLSILQGALLLLGAARAAEPLEFHVTFDAGVSQEPFTGRVYVMLEPGTGRQPRLGPNLFSPGPFFAVDVKNWKPGESLVVGNAAVAFPAPLSELEAGVYSVQAVMDFDRGARDFSNAPGNGYSEATSQELDPDSAGVVRLQIDQVVAPRPFPENERVKLVDIKSELLSRFHGRELRLRAGVVLPSSYGKDPEKRYPVIYNVPGFSGTHFGAFQAAKRNATDVDGVEMLYVVLDPDCRLGHHVFADSDNNGPVGQAVVDELIPHIESRFRAIGKPAARFVTGHSSGGWSSLWLQVTYPDIFGGVWSTAPDPVDFQDFSRIDIYTPGTNMFKDAQGELRPIARLGGKPVLFLKPLSDVEVVMGHGGQLGSFEAVFSPRGPDGEPKQLWNRATREIDPAVAAAWKRYDIRLILEQNWQILGPKLEGKVHVITGSEDTFYLEGAVALLKEALVRLGSDAVIEIVPGKNHFNLVDTEMRQRIAREMADAFRKHELDQTPRSTTRFPRKARFKAKQPRF
jgi:S-formylglutathione hydrolase FrmB